MSLALFTTPRSSSLCLTDGIDTRRTRIIRDLGLPTGREEIIELMRYPRELNYSSEAYDILQSMMLLEATGARRLREELEYSRMAPILRNLGRNDFTGIGYGGLGWGRLGDGLGLGNPLQDRLYGSLLNGGMGGWDTMSDYLMPFMGSPGRYGGLGGMSPYLSGGIGGLGGYPGYTGIGALAGGRRGLGLGGRHNGLMRGYRGYGGALAGLGGLPRYGRSFLT